MASGGTEEWHQEGRLRVKAEHLPTHIPAKIEEDYTESVLPQHPCLQLVSNSEQTLSKVTSRRLLTFEKAREPTVDEMDEHQVDIMDFREKYFVIREETRKERRLKQAKIREEDRLKHLNKQSL
nr:unnamed protein product [Callosobruchus analis]